MRGADGVVLLKSSEEFIPKYLYYYLQKLEIEEAHKYMRHFKHLKRIDIPVPPKEIQQKIIKEIEQIEKNEKDGLERIEKLEIEINYSILNMQGTTTLIKSVAKINPSKSSELKELPDDLEVSFYEMAAIRNEGGYEFHDKRKLQQVRKGFTSFRNRDVIWAKITPCMENGKCAVVDNLTNGYGFGSTEFHVLRTDIKRCLPEILYHIIRQKEFRNKAKNVMTGASGHKRVPAQFIEEYIIQLPSIEKQKKLVAIIEKKEKEIEKLNLALSTVDTEKKEVLKKYL